MATYYPPEIMLLQGCPFQSSARITWQMSNKGKGPDPQGTAANSPGIAPRYMGTHCTRVSKQQSNCPMLDFNSLYTGAWFKVGS